VAKARIALERLSDAKAQLTDARAKFPKSMEVAYWLAWCEKALGNKASAETGLNDAIALVDPSEPNAILPYVGLAQLLSQLGRSADAQGKLEEAQKKLPESPILRRALGDVDADQGHYEEAIEQYRAALDKEPKDLATRFRLGVTLLKKPDLDAAAAE